MTSNKIIPLGGRHKSGGSLLAEAMNDPALDHCVLVSFDSSGEGYAVSHFGMTRERLCFAAELIRRVAFDEMQN